MKKIILIFTFLISIFLIKAQNNDSILIISKDSNNSQVYDFARVEEKPEYSGGLGKLYEFLNKNIKYPDYELKKKISGTVYVQFVVTKSGAITQVQIAKGVSQGLDEESERAVRAMPNWKPGMVKGKPVNVKFFLPIKYTLVKEGSKRKKNRE